MYYYAKAKIKNTITHYVTNRISSAANPNAAARGSARVNKRCVSAAGESRRSGDRQENAGGRLLRRYSTFCYTLNWAILGMNGSGALPACLPAAVAGCLDGIRNSPAVAPYVGTVAPGVQCSPIHQEPRATNSHHTYCTTYYLPPSVAAAEQQKQAPLAQCVSTTFVAWRHLATEHMSDKKMVISVLLYYR